MGQNFTYKKVDDNSRVTEEISKHVCLGDGMDPKQIFYPTWRSPNQKKFMSPDGFVHRLRTKFSGEYDKQAWDIPQNNIFMCKYQGGYSETGDISRKRNSEAEISEKCYNSTNPVDPWKYRLEKSTTWRTHLAQKSLNKIINPTKTYKNLKDDNELNELSITPNMQNDALSSKKTLIIKNPIPGTTKASRMPLLKSYNPREETANSQRSIKLYKKSLENHYFEFNSHPMKTVISEKAENDMKNLSISSINILKSQLSTRHWTSEFNSNIDVESQFKQMKDMKKPIENLHQRYNVISASSPIYRTDRKSVV